MDDLDDVSLLPGVRGLLSTSAGLINTSAWPWRLSDGPCPVAGRPSAAGHQESRAGPSVTHRLHSARAAIQMQLRGWGVEGGPASPERPSVPCPRRGSGHIHLRRGHSASLQGSSSEPT